MIIYIIMGLYLCYLWDQFFNNLNTDLNRNNDLRSLFKMNKNNQKMIENNRPTIV